MTEEPESTLKKLSNGMRDRCELVGGWAHV